MDYPLEQLGPERFQQLCQALLVKEFPRVHCFPVAQPDGGRDGISYIPDEGSNKFIVFQVKFARKPLAEADPHKWLTAIVEEEAPKIHKLIPRGASRFCLITNIPGTSHLDTGSIDKVNKLLESHLSIPATCWWRDDLNRRLDDAWDLKWAFPELLQATDILRAVLDSGLNEHRDRRTAAIRAFLRSQYDMDEEVRFKQVELQNKLLDLFIDVPLSFRDAQAEKTQHFLFRKVIAGRQTTVGQDEEELHDNQHMFFENGARWYPMGEEQIGTATLLLSRGMQEAMPHVVLEGAPGQGKSTISQYICQVHRMRLLQEDEALTQIDPDHAASQMRLPIKVDLRDFAIWLGKRDPFNAEDGAPANWTRTLEAFLAALISHESGGTHFTTDDLLAILRLSAVLLVFDGLDEVADLVRRKDVVDELVKGVQRISENAASLQVVITSRPAAFANSPGMPHRKFPHLQLNSLPKSLILAYADRWLRARKLDSKQTSEFRLILKEKLDQPHLRDLARNPMQLAILLSLIHTRGSSLPDKRTALYDYYIDLFFSREAAKSTTVRDHRELLIDIHRYLAWLLHSEAEQGNSRASITQQRLYQIIEIYLSKEGHDTGLAEKLFTGMLERVVAIVSRVEGTYEFEVQPLREYFAACHLYYTAPHSSPGKEASGSKPDRFDAISRNFFWLNVTRFYAGCYSKGELPSLVDRLEELVTEEDFRLSDVTRSLAITLLGDWVFTQLPKSVKKTTKFTIEGNGLRYLLSTQFPRRGRGAQGTLSLPPRCGRAELLDECFRQLELTTGKDFSYQLVEVIKANSENDPTIADRWLQRLTDLTGMPRLSWLEIGTDLGLLAKLDMARLKDIVSSTIHLHKVPTLRVLFRAGRTDYIEASEELFDVTVEAILSREISASTQRRVESALHTLSHALNPVRYYPAFRDRQPRPLAELVETRYQTAKLTWPDELTTMSEQYKNHAACVTLGKVAEMESQRSTLEWATDIGPWDTLIETGRSLWGERWAFTTLANTAAGIRSNKETCSETSELLDHSKSLARRFRYARLRSGNLKWWNAQFDAIQTGRDRELVLLACLTWAKTHSLVTLHKLLDESLFLIDEPAWVRIHAGVGLSRALSHPNSERQESIDATELPGGLSLRFVCALMDRADQQAQRKIFSRFLRKADLKDPIVRRFAAQHALDEGNIGTSDWNPNLATIKDCYKNETVVSGHVRYWHQSERRMMSKQFATKISAEASAFPTFLLSAAQDVLRAEAKARVVPVATTALDEGWFPSP